MGARKRDRPHRDGESLIRPPRCVISCKKSWGKSRNYQRRDGNCSGFGTIISPLVPLLLREGKSSKEDLFEGTSKGSIVPSKGEGGFSRRNLSASSLRMCGSLRIRGFSHKEEKDLSFVNKEMNILTFLGNLEEQNDDMSS